MENATSRGAGRNLALAAILLTIAASVLIPKPSFALASLDAEEVAFCNLINNYRASRGLPALRVSTSLTNAADWHSLDMATKNYFSHTDSLGRSSFTRMSAFGYSYGTYKGENIAAGNWSASATFEQWKNSSGHNANMLNANYKVMGIGRNYNALSTYKYYWTNDFGGYVDSSIPCPSAPAPAPSSGTTPSVRISDVSLYEGSLLSGPSARFTVRLSASSASTVKVSYATANGSAIAGSDYSARSGTLSIAPGYLSATISVPITADRIRESDETFWVKLSSPVAATIGDGSGIGVIRNDD